MAEHAGLPGTVQGALRYSGCLRAKRVDGLVYDWIAATDVQSDEQHTGANRPQKRAPSSRDTASHTSCAAGIQRLTCRGSKPCAKFLVGCHGRYAS